MVDRPILFSGPMVKALLEGRKTQTRRMLTPNNTLWNGHPWTKQLKAQTWDWARAWVDGGPSPAGNPGPYLHLPWLAGDDDQWEDTSHRIYPIVQPGDRLWVREAWARTSVAPIVSTIDNPMVVYQEIDNRTDYGGPWKPSIHMPRAASRLTLTVTDVRVQRLQEISPADARDEGVDRRSRSVRQMWLCGATPEERDAIYLRACVWEYQQLWNALHGDGSWDANPWVVALTFIVERRNIDA